MLIIKKIKFSRIQVVLGFVCLLESSFFLESEFQENKLFSDI